MLIAEERDASRLLRNTAQATDAAQTKHDPLEDWLWYMALPLLAHILLMVAAFVLRENPASALYIVGSAMILLLLVGIRNAWDMVTFLAVERAHSENKSRSGEEVVRPVEKKPRSK